MLLKIRFLAIFSLLSLICFAQPSNPYNDVGVRLANDIKNILPDLQNLKLSELNENKINELKKNVHQILV